MKNKHKTKDNSNKIKTDKISNKTISNWRATNFADKTAVSRMPLKLIKAIIFSNPFYTRRTSRFAEYGKYFSPCLIVVTHNLYENVIKLHPVFC